MEHQHGSHQACEHGRQYPAYFLPVSILIAGVLISGSIFYNTKILVTKLEKGSFALAAEGAAAQLQQPAGAPNQQIPPVDDKPVDVPSREDAPVIGKSKAKVTLVEFSDFQCPFCQSFYKDTFTALKTKYIDTGKVQLVFRHYPLNFHQNAQKAAEAAECANKQGRFSEYHDLLFTKGQADGTGLAVEDLKKYADSLNLNKGTLGFGKDRFNKCLDSGETAEAVKKDMDNGNSIGVSGTPTLFVNGKRIVGAQPVSVFEQAIEEALK